MKYATFSLPQLWSQIFSNSIFEFFKVFYDAVNKRFGFYHWPYSYLSVIFDEFFFQWQELLARKPKEGEEDPVLVEEIRKARENVGMYTRKTSFEYEELDPIRFEKHKTFLVQLLTKVLKDTASKM